MSDFLNPLGGRFIGPSGPVSTSAVMGTVPDPPRGFRLLDPGTIIKGVVLGRESDGLTAIATDKGTIRVASNVPLPAGTQVTLEVRPAGDRLQVLILANDAAQHQTPTPTTGQGTPATPIAPQPAGSGGAQGAEARPSPTTAPTQPARADPPSIQFVGSSLRAVVVHAPPPQARAQAEAQAQLPIQPQPQPQTTPAPPQPQLPPTPPQAGLPQMQPPQAQPPQVPAPQAQPPQPGQSAPPQPVPPSLPPVLGSPPLPAPPPPASTGTVPPIATQPSIPPATVPVSAPVTTAPVTTAPVTSTVTPPVTPSPQGAQLPSSGAQPVPQGPTLPNVPGPVVIPNTATIQAGLLAATAEKRDKPPQPGTVVTAAATQRTGAAPLPHMPPAATASPAAPGGNATTPAVLPTGSSQQIPASSALSADSKLRILALFASASATAELSQHAATDEVQSAQQPITAKHPAMPLPLGAELKLRVLAVQMQAHHQVEIDPLSIDPDGHGQVIFGRVVSMTPAGNVVIHTPIGDIMLQDRSSLPLGARLALAIDTLETAPPPAAIAAPPVLTPQQALLTLGQSWPTLADLIAIFRSAGGQPGQGGGIDPDIAHQAMGLLPHAGNRLGAGLMNAMAALRSGDIGKLLGPLFAAKGAGPEREEMVRRLRNEFTQLSALAQERPEVDWRALFLPVIDDQGRVTQINLFYRRPKKGEAADRAGGTGTRFVVEADFSRLGPFQLDGLMRQQRFDLMIRSRTRLTDRMRREIEAIYEEARGITGFAGSIAFQTVDEFPVIPLDDLKRGTPTVMV
jgi:hypothetical protein